MRYKRYITLLFLMGLAVLVNGQSLEEYLKMAAENNPHLQAKYAEFEAALQRVAQASALPDPTLSLGYFISPVETRVGPQRTRISLSQMFPWFGTLKTAGNVSQLQAQAKYQEFLEAKNELFMQVKSAWYPLYELNRKVALQQKNNTILKTYKALAITSFRNGKGTMVDVLRVDIMTDNNDTDVKLLQDQLKPLQVYFNQLLNRVDTLPVLVADTLSLTVIPENYRKDSLLINHPILQAYDLKYQSAQQAELLAKKQALPKFGVGLDYALVAQGNNTFSDNGKDIWMPMLSMSIPIFRKKYDASLKEAQYNQEAIKAYKKAFTNQLISAYEMAWYEAQKSRELLELYDRQIKKTEQIITLLITAYSNSGKDFEEVLRMQQELLKYQMAEATAIKAYHTALAKIDYLTTKSE